MKNDILQQKLKDLICEKARREDPIRTVLYVRTYVQQLNLHIAGQRILSAHEIERKLDYLIGCVTITMNQFYSRLEFLRARWCEGRNFNNIDELSYIQKTQSDFPKRGRLNKSGVSLFYASIIHSEDDDALNAVLSEVGARDLDQMNILRSEQKENQALTLCFIGIWDYIRCKKKPLLMPQHVYDYYQDAHNYMKKKFSPQLLTAYYLTDRFLADIMSRKGSKRLYEVTSEAGAIMLESESIDGILYESVEANGQPVIALKPDAVDEKLDHKFVTAVSINNHLGYEFFVYRNESKAVIDSTTGCLAWNQL